MATIGLLAYKIVADTTGFSQGVTATRAELRAAKAITEQTMTANEKLEDSLKGLEHLYNIGAISAQTYSRAVDRIQDEANEAAAANRNFGAATTAATAAQDSMLASQLAGLPVVGGFASGFGSLSPAVIGATAAVAAFAAGIGVVYVTGRSLINTVAESTESILALDRAAQQLGMSSVSLAGIRDAASDFAGVSPDQVDAAIQQMNVRLAKAVAGTGKQTFELLEQYGLQPMELAAMGSEQAFLKLVDVIGQIHHPMERARVAAQLFGKSGVDLLNVFEAGSGAIQASVANAEEIGLALSEDKTANVVNMAHAFDDLADISEGFGNQLAGAVAPAIAGFAVGMVDAMQAGQPLRNILDSTVTVVGALANNVGTFADIGAFAFGGAATAAGVLLQQVEFVIGGVAVLNKGLASIGIGKVNEELQQLSDDVQKLANTTFQSGVQLMADGLEGKFSDAIEKARDNIANTARKTTSVPGFDAEGLFYNMEAYEKKKRQTKAKVKKAKRPTRRRVKKAQSRTQVGAVTRGTTAAFSASKAAAETWRLRQEELAKEQIQALRKNNDELKKQNAVVADIRERIFANLGFEFSEARF